MCVVRRLQPFPVLPRLHHGGPGNVSRSGLKTGVPSVVSAGRFFRSGFCPMWAVSVVRAVPLCSFGARFRCSTWNLRSVPVCFLGYGRRSLSSIPPRTGSVSPWGWRVPFCPASSRRLRNPRRGSFRGGGSPTVGVPRGTRCLGAWFSGFVGRRVREAHPAAFGRVLPVTRSGSGLGRPGCRCGGDGKPTVMIPDGRWCVSVGPGSASPLFGKRVCIPGFRLGAEGQRVPSSDGNFRCEGLRTDGASVPSAPSGIPEGALLALPHVPRGTSAGAVRKRKNSVTVRKAHEDMADCLPA